MKEEQISCKSSQDESRRHREEVIDQSIEPRSRPESEPIVAMIKMRGPRPVAHHRPSTIHW
jgi:hypothetical protein